MVVRGRRYHRSLGGGTVWASLVVVTAVHRSIRNWQEVVLLDIFFVGLEGDKVVGLGSQLLMDGVRYRRYLGDSWRHQLQIMIDSRRLIIDWCFFLLIRLLLLLLALFHGLPSFKLAAHTFLLRHLFLILLFWNERFVSASARLMYLIGLSLGRVPLFFLSRRLERYVYFLYQVFIRRGVVSLLIFQLFTL